MYVRKIDTILDVRSFLSEEFIRYIISFLVLVAAVVTHLTVIQIIMYFCTQNQDLFRVSNSLIKLNNTFRFSAFQFQTGFDMPVYALLYLFYGSEKCYIYSH